MAPMARHRDESDRSLTWPDGPGRPDRPDDSPGGTVLARTARGRTVVELYGEIDLAVVLATTPQLYALTAVQRPWIVADLRQVSFIDCSGLALLVDVRARVLASDGTFTMVCDDPKVLRLLRITGLATLLAPVPTLEEPAPDGPALDGEGGPCADEGAGPGTERPGMRKGRET
ncbi:STAS domain-containing protein [Streptomyces iconiensis]|uniref:Anti-sigma factor antagonist n=1 Tax=Streptomyces iconiensis TaxID=1384038 RepID=A0ABT6ZRD7_9ACTN|nr:STAS domain-containing protein [Streptomyces iconiensis]MDJ1131630.1 STAS domain-containing protein [Streptomyces iconiensis]